MFEQLATSDGILGTLSRSMRAGLTFFWGQYGLPIPFATKVIPWTGRESFLLVILMKHLQVCICLGEPIEVEKVEKPTEEQINKLQAEYIEKIHQLFESHKAAAGYPDAVLQIT